jgi:multidrug efflux pump
VQPASVVDTLRSSVEALNAELPAGYTIVPGGSVEESAKSTSSVAAVVPAALLIMLVGLMIQLQSFSRLFLVLSVAPFGLIGLVAALLSAGKSLGFVAILGVLALAGMIVRNSVILVDQIDTEIAHGRAPWDAVIEATLTPLSPDPSHGGRRHSRHDPDRADLFWGPMAYSVMGGPAGATLLTLVFLPALYVA